ncbi:MAG: ribbon-helix-helix domain-containing protein [Alphaproteobacteria bacterium]|jgi:predicted DNA-binding ribbon-helix-helix protein|nr:ribbon-helix-helix domain-containing protein [Alphaproteobacteria bacterium]
MMKTPNPDDIVDYQVNPVTKIKRNVTIDKRRTTLMLEQEIWTILDELAREEGLSIDELCNQIHHFHDGSESISSVLRIIAVLACRVVQTNSSTSGHAFHNNQMMFPSRLHQALNRLNPATDA